METNQPKTVSLLHQGTLSEVLQPFAEQMNGLLEKFSKLLITESVRQIKPLSATLSNACTELYTLFDKSARIMLDLGWPPISDFGHRRARSIVQAYELHGRDAVRPMFEEFMLWHYDDAALKAMLSAWQKDKRLANRLPILRQAVESHLAGNYFASIPTILPQIEGIIPERYGHPKGTRVRCEHLLKYVPELLDTKGCTFLDEWMKRFYSAIVMVGFDYGDDPKSSLSRHAILHGYDTSYGTAANSLRAILVFDYLQSSLYRLVGTPISRCYHLVGCPSISADTPNLVVYETLSLAEISGKRPCKRCNPDSIEPLPVLP